MKITLIKYKEKKDKTTFLSKNFKVIVLELNIFLIEIYFKMLIMMKFKIQIWMQIKISIQMILNLKFKNKTTFLMLSKVILKKLKIIEVK